MRTLSKGTKRDMVHQYLLYLHIPNFIYIYIYIYIFETNFLHHSPVEQLAIMPLGHHFSYSWELKKSKFICLLKLQLVGRKLSTCHFAKSILKDI